MSAIRVTPEDLQVSAATVDVHADDVQMRHTAADGRIEAASVGVPAGSLTALSAAVAKWQGDTAALFGQMVDHGHALRTGAAAYQQTDQQSAAQIGDVGAAISPRDIGL